eukprot:TRINITY_DN25546_c0_g1_i1.p1 TRINITY_DN25546_c0_g1~~TRINITY_DN25546_c0_g1_i1.p1  ORF type:complete len:489 (-),score=87.69 TRINITY_DN25546_c0_g1_i1:51-1517(-)
MFALKKKEPKVMMQGEIAPSRDADFMKTLLIGVGVALLVWMAIVSVLLIYLGIRYLGETVDGSRQRYTAITAERVGAKAVKVLDAAHAARLAVEYAIQRQLYFEPLDYETLRMSLEPAFASMPSIRAVDVAFIGRNDSLSLQRKQVAGETSYDLLLQSDAQDCVEKLGRLGCLQSLPGRAMEWYRIGMELPGGQEADNASARSSPLSNFVWAPAPGFVAHPEGAIRERGAAVAWSPAHSLIFKSVFPGTSGQLALIARVIIDVTHLRSDKALDDAARLGESGVIVLIDRSGTLLATLNPGAQTLVKSPEGIAYFRKISELAGGWTGSVTEDRILKAVETGSEMYQSGDWLVAMSQLKGLGNANFLVVVASEKAPFVDETLNTICGLARAVIISPYPAAAIVIVFTYILSSVNARRRMRKVHALEEKNKQDMANRALKIMKHPGGLGGMSVVSKLAAKARAAAKALPAPESKAITDGDPGAGMSKLRAP